MRKLLILPLILLLGLACGSALSPAADAAGATPLITRRQPAPYALVLIQGKLEQDPLAHEAPFYGTFSTGWFVTVNGQRFWVDLGGNKDLLEKARKLAGKKVLLAGSLEMRQYHLPEFWIGPYRPHTKNTIKPPLLGKAQVVRLSSLEALQNPSGGEVVNVDLLGKLTYYELESYPPIPVWEVIVGDQTFRLRFTNDELRQKARSFEGERVLVSGTLQNGVLVVTRLQPPPMA